MDLTLVRSISSISGNRSRWRKRPRWRLRFSHSRESPSSASPISDDENVIRASEIPSHTWSGERKKRLGWRAAQSPAFLRREPSVSYRRVPKRQFLVPKIQLESSRPMAVVPFKNDWEVFVREVTRLEYAPAEGDHCFIFDRLPPSTRVTRRFWLTI